MNLVKVNCGDEEEPVFIYIRRDKILFILEPTVIDNFSVIEGFFKVVLEGYIDGLLIKQRSEVMKLIDNEGGYLYE